MTTIVNKNILVGITGGIAAYKSADLIRRLRDAGAQVRVVMTAAAKQFITPLTLQAVSGQPVHDDLFDLHAEAAMGHIELARWADLILIAPASANIIAKLANGFADDLLSTLCLASTAPLAIAPAMNQMMWQHTATQENIEALKQRGTLILGPGEGSQACGEIGPGRMLEPTELVTQIQQLFPVSSLAGKHVVITAGPTQEALDPVRYLSNHSSGKMGYALAEAALAAGARVTLISGPVQLTPPTKTKFLSVISAKEMHEAVMAQVSNCDIFIAAAAVADYRYEQPATQKMAKQAAEITLKFIRNPDIVASVAALPRKPFTVGFAAQTEDLLQRAKAKLVDKKLDMIAANWVGCAGTGFNSDTNALTVCWPEGEVSLAPASKKIIAHQLINLISEHYATKHST